MENRILFLILGLCISINSFSQNNEYQYIALKFGASHGFSGTPAFNANKYLITPDGEMQATPVSSFKGYTPGFVADLLYHFDFTTDNAGIFTGLEYNYGGISAKYVSQDPNVYSMVETYRMHTVGLPIAFKYGPDIWESQRYLFVGLQINYIIAISSVQKYDWKATPSALKLEKEEYNPTQFALFFGVNYSAFNLQFDFYPSSVFNKSYKDANDFKIHEGQVDNSFAIKTSVNIPYGWLSDQSFWWKRKLKKLKIWK